MADRYSTQIEPSSNDINVRLDERNVGNYKRQCTECNVAFMVPLNEMGIRLECPFCHKLTKG